MPMHYIGRKPVYTQNVKFIGAMVSDFKRKINEGSVKYFISYLV